MAAAQQFSYVEVDPSLGTASALPYVPITLQRPQQSVTKSALVDSGAALSVLPYSIGLQLGAVWEEQTMHFSSLDRLVGFRPFASRSLGLGATMFRSSWAKSISLWSSMYLSTDRACYSK